jgi:hypothetical protein
MSELVVPKRLSSEFKTVASIWNLGASTSFLDALVLCWVKHEKQLRKLFSFILYRHPFVDSGNFRDIERTMAANKRLFPESFMREIEVVGGVAIPDLVGPRYDELFRKIAQIHTYRDKVMHGQVSATGIGPKKLQDDALVIIEWIDLLGAGAEAAFGYDGVVRDSFAEAKKQEIKTIGNCPFNSLESMKNWIAGIKR